MKRSSTHVRRAKDVHYLEFHLVPDLVLPYLRDTTILDDLHVDRRRGRVTRATGIRVD